MNKNLVEGNLETSFQIESAYILGLGIRLTDTLAYLKNDVHSRLFLVALFKSPILETI